MVDVLLSLDDEVVKEVVSEESEVVETVSVVFVAESVVECVLVKVMEVLVVMEEDDVTVTVIVVVTLVRDADAVDLLVLEEALMVVVLDLDVLHSEDIEEVVLKIIALVEIILVVVGAEANVECMIVKDVELLVVMQSSTPSPLKSGPLAGLGQSCRTSGFAAVSWPPPQAQHACVASRPPLAYLLNCPQCHCHPAPCPPVLVHQL